MPRRDSTADGTPLFVEIERTQIHARRYEGPAARVEWFEDLPTVNVPRVVRVVPRSRLASGTNRQPGPTKSDLDASYAAAMRALARR